MNIVWLFSETTDLGPSVNIDQLHDLAPIWGSWRTWRGYGTDNVVCYEAAQAHVLIEQDYQSVCNLYVPQEAWEKANRPQKVFAFGGAFPESTDHGEDIISMHLAASQAQIVLMVGFELDAKQPSNSYIELVAQTMKAYSQVQWVLVDHSEQLAKPLQGLKNVTCDKLNNVLQLLNANS